MFIIIIIIINLLCRVSCDVIEYLHLWRLHCQKLFTVIISYRPDESEEDVHLYLPPYQALHYSL